MCDLINCCPFCLQPLANHCDGCCENVKIGIKVKKFCGKKGNLVRFNDSCD